ncbi:hypothetical protein PFISCL1PPCAC_13464, partial [Pristionchus fissidentatus]
DFKRGLFVNDGFWPSQADDGTVFCVNQWKSEPIYVNYVRNYDSTRTLTRTDYDEITATKSWTGDIRSCACFGSALFFLADKTCAAVSVKWKCSK